jgi:hypothetical protein
MITYKIFGKNRIEQQRPGLVIPIYAYIVLWFFAIEYELRESTILKERRDRFGLP